MRWTLITISQSTVDMRWKMRSRRIPALLTTLSTRPKASSAVRMMRSAPAGSPTLSALATAVPPAARISSTTSWAGPVSGLPSPSAPAPRSLTTTRPPWLPARSAISRPMPRPAPVTTMTLPSRHCAAAIPDLPPPHVFYGAAVERPHFAAASLCQRRAPLQPRGMGWELVPRSTNPLALRRHATIRSPRDGCMGPLAGFKIVEMAGIGPAPMCAMLLADLGATVLRVDRQQPSDLGLPGDARFSITNRSRHAIAVDLKNPEAVVLVLRLVAAADALIEGFRPGVMERLGLGPEPCLARNPKLVFARMTGWGQQGPIAQ